MRHPRPTISRCAPLVLLAPVIGACLIALAALADHVLRHPRRGCNLQHPVASLFIVTNEAGRLDVAVGAIERPLGRICVQMRQSRSSHSSLPFATREETRCSWRITLAPGVTLAPDEELRLRQLAIPMFAEVYGAPRTPKTTSDVCEKRPLLLGHLANGAILAVWLSAVAFCCLVVDRWTRDAMDAALTPRALVLRAGLCPACRYSLAGLPSPRCPECGAEVPSSEWPFIPPGHAAIGHDETAAS